MLAKFILPSKTYTSIPGVNVPGERVPQLEQTVFCKSHNCTTSKPLTAVTTVTACVPKFCPTQVLGGKLEPAGISAPVN